MGDTFEQRFEEPCDQVVFKREVHRTYQPTEKDETVHVRVDEKSSEDEEYITSDDSRDARRVITIRKRIVKRIIVLPDGSRKEVEEELPADVVSSDYDEVESDTISSIVVPEDTTVVQQVKPIERVHVTRVIRKPDGTENVIDESDTIYPLEFTPEDERSASVEEEKDDHGVVVRRVVRRPVMVTEKRTVIRRTEVLPDGKEREMGKSVEESPKEEDEPKKVRRIVRKFKVEPTGEKTTDEPEYVSPLECSTTEESEPEEHLEPIKGKHVRTVSRRSITTSQKRVIRRVMERKDGQPVEPVEDTIEEPVEATKCTIVRTVTGVDGKPHVVEKPDYTLPKDAKVTVDEEKDNQGVVIRKVVRRPLPVITRRRVYRKVVLAPDGTEKGVEEKVEEALPVDVPDEAHEDFVPEPMLVEEQESVPDTFEQRFEEPCDQVVFKREVHRTYQPTEKDKTVHVRVHEKPSEDEEYITPDDSRDVRRVITIRKRIVKRIIVLPDGSRKEVEEELPVDDVSIDYDEVERDTISSIVVPEDTTVVQQVKPIERVHVTRVIRRPDGTENVIDESDTIYPLEFTPEDERSASVEEEKDDHGLVVRRVVRRPVMVTEKRTVIRRTEILPDGKQREVGKS